MREHVALHLIRVDLPNIVRTNGLTVGVIVPCSYSVGDKLGGEPGCSGRWCAERKERMIFRQLSLQRLGCQFSWTMNVSLSLSSLVDSLALSLR